MEKSESYSFEEVTDWGNAFSISVTHYPREEKPYFVWINSDNPIKECKDMREVRSFISEYVLSYFENKII